MLLKEKEQRRVGTLDQLIKLCGGQRQGKPQVFRVVAHDATGNGVLIADPLSEGEKIRPFEINQALPHFSQTLVFERPDDGQAISHGAR